ncbi:serine/threonine-protein phosphatase 7 long form homolog [Arachis duranensis]|uniref:Serine/threonine-protein phosphatase 7 long form homolog n=1 Tax=Arachis duranensis TaxID=130453 RepID=A0A6P4DXC7_ARADU|nr:serine/threonine-protein phosphatase 7 long form homolog [Arachis duranensis]
MVPLRNFTFNNSLITAFVERWHPETHTFHLPWGETTITLQDVAYHLGLRAYGDSVRGCFHNFGKWYHTETWERWWSGCWVPGLRWLHSRRQKKESFTLKLVWLWDRVRQMLQIDDPETLRQYARCYIMLLIGGYLMTDKSNNLVHLRWLPLLQDFWAVLGVILGLGCADLDVSVTVFDGTPRRHGHCWLHSAIDIMDIPEIFSVVSTRARDLHLSDNYEV